MLKIYNIYLMPYQLLEGKTMNSQIKIFLEFAFEC